MNRKFEIHSSIILVVLALSMLISLADLEAQQLPDYELAYGWEWAVEPMPGTARSWSSNGVLALIDENRNGDLIVVLGYPSSTKPLGPVYRPVAFDSKHRRHDFESGGGVGSGQMSMSRFRLDHTTLFPDSVKYLGVELLTVDGRRMVSKRAAKTAKSKGIEVLPFPDVNEPFEFELTDHRGKSIDSRKYKGKTMIVDCWATWCKPCMRKMPKLKKLLENVGPKNIVVVGVNFDQSPENMMAAIDSLDILWPQVIVSSDEEIRRLWHDVSTVWTLPRIFVIDGRGILRGDVAPYQLEELVQQLVDEGS
ncbi:MAG: redoxin domain-containing protein [Candidatus Latescibacteria bacterium]|nr:redoxin domain-containing protein [Candidatus Latescibacterota bacterium]NIO56887.1 redoxin domain-containing protein [Candidatus Latescibacterota bacterium]